MFLSKYSAALAAGLTVLVYAPIAAAAPTLTSAIAGGKAATNLQYRYEDVSTGAAIANEAKAHTVRLRFGYATDTFEGFGAMVEAESISALGGKKYDSRALGQTANGYAVIADPESTEINQAYLSYSGLPKTTMKWGRQRIKLDNDRFIGNVGWRQNEQTFDAFTLVNTSLPQTTLTVGYISNVNRVFSDSSATPTTGPAGGNHKMKSTIFNANYKGLGIGEVVAYAYLLDYDRASAVTANTANTYGIRLNGGTPFAGKKLLYTAEFASQRDGGNNPVRYKANYVFLEGGVDIGSGTVFKLGYEVLGTDLDATTKASGAVVAAGKSFSTPLATLHAFNGWADMFLATPSHGLSDIYVSMAGELAGLKLGAVFHDYRADKTTKTLSSDQLGSEWNFVVSKAFGKNYAAGFKYAKYAASGTPSSTFGSANVDTRKAWLWGEVKF